MHMLDCVSMTWVTIQAKGDIPSPRYGHALAVLGNQMLLSGGADNQTPFSDLYVLDLGEQLVLCCHPLKCSPCNLQIHSCGGRYANKAQKATQRQRESAIIP